MKRNIKITTTLILAALTAILFTSCFDPVYYTVRHDVKPEKATIFGHQINSIARFRTNGKEYLVLAANGGLKFKTADNPYHGQWNTYGNLPFELPHYDIDSKATEGFSILKVLADKDNLYLVTTSYKNVIPSDIKIWSCAMPKGWSTPASEWNDLTKEKNVKLTPNLFNVFYTNDYENNNRAAYLRVDIVEGEEDKKTTTYKYYNLPSLDENTSIKAFEDEKLPVNSVTNGKFFNSIAAVSDDTYFYVSKGKELYYGKADEPFENYKKVDAGATIASLALTSDSILVGCGTGNSVGGLKRGDLTKDGDTVTISSITDNFSNNAQSQILLTYQVPCLLNATPKESEAKSQIYATVTFPDYPSGNNKNKDKGLWSYYPNRGNWNKE